MIVVDVGCKGYEAETSIDRLVTRFAPTLMFGFDPYPELREGVSVIDGTVVVQKRIAAWTGDGTLGFRFDGTRSCHDPTAPDTVRCFDLASWLLTLPGDDTVLKLDCEGAEYPLLSHLLRRKADHHLGLILVEWHEPDAYRHADALAAHLACPVELWD